MFTKQYETVFILTPVLSDTQAKDAVDKFRKVLEDAGASMVHEEAWGLKKLAYPIQKKGTGYYHLMEFTADPAVIAPLETEFRRDERVMRFLTVLLDKHAVTYNERKRKGLVGRKQQEETAPAEN